MVKFVDLGVLYFSLVLPVQSRWTAGGPEWTLRSLGGTVGCDRNRMANLSKASNVVQEKCILYDVTGVTQKWHSILSQPTVD